jgi:transcription-repair coupling factor (superfamily II helicase)
VSVPGELVGLTAALADIIEPHVPDPRRGARLGVPETAKGPVAAAIAARREGPVLLLVPTPSRSLAVHEEVLLYLKDVPLARLPEREGLPYEFARSDALVAVERARALAALRGPGRALVIASWAALSEHCSGPDVEASGINAKVGETLDPGMLVSQLEEAGYLIEPMADRPGSVSHRGGLVDVFPANEDRPYRVEFFGNEVESIREVDLSTQRSIRSSRRPLPAGSHSTRQAGMPPGISSSVEDTGSSRSSSSRSSRCWQRATGAITSRSWSLSSIERRRSTICRTISALSSSTTSRTESRRSPGSTSTRTGHGKNWSAAETSPAGCRRGTWRWASLPRCSLSGRGAFTSSASVRRSWARSGCR